MSDVINAIFGLRGVRVGDADVTLQWAMPLAAWVWVLLVIGAGALALWSYSRLAGARGWRWTLGVVRALVLLIVLAMLAGPQLARQRETIERDWVIVMADRSQSMTIQDAPWPTVGGARETQLTQALRELAPELERIGRERNVLVLGFDAGVYEVWSGMAGGGDSGGLALNLSEPTGRRTDVPAALDQALRRVAGRPVSGVVLLSDGRSVEAPSRSLLRQLQSRQIPVFTVAIGSEKSAVDYAVSRVSAPSLVFVNDLVPVTVDVDRYGGAGGDRPAKVELIDEATQLVLESRELSEFEDAAGGEGVVGGTDGASQVRSRRVVLTARPDSAGPRSWAVRVVSEAGRDLSADNDRAPIALRVVDRPIRIAYFDGYPRWEYRFLKNLLLRERSMRSSVMLLSANRRFIQEGSDPLLTVPRSAEEWKPFDVIVMGDLRPSLFSVAQLELVKQAVAERGVGLLWIGGAGATPGAWAGSPLADLLPFSLARTEGGESGSLGSGTGAGVRAWAEPVVMSPTPAADRLGLLRLSDDASALRGWPAILTDPEATWAHLQYAQAIDVSSVKPAAEVLARVTRVGESLGGSAGGDAAGGLGSPAVLTMRYGAGRIVYVATDEVWRWRYARGETLPERFYLPIVRLLARESLVRSGQQALLEVSPESALVEQGVSVSVRLLDQSLVASKPATITVRITREGAGGGGGGGGGGPALSTTLVLSPQTGSVGAGGGGEGGGLYTGTWIPVEPGRYAVEPSEALLSGLGLREMVDVRDRQDELRTPQADHGLLAALSAETGGKVLGRAELSSVGSMLPNRQVRLLGTPQIETLWDKPVVWIVLIVLLTVEWVGRRLIRLV